MKKTYLVLGTIIVLVAVGLLVFGRPTTAPEKPILEEAPVAETGKTITISYQNNAFSPSEVTAQIGDKLVFQNNHVAAMRVASNPHPIHTSYPGLDSDTLAPGESYEFKITEKAIISYHNHFNPAAGGKIVVE